MTQALPPSDLSPQLQCAYRAEFHKTYYESLRNELAIRMKTGAICFLLTTITVLGFALGTYLCAAGPCIPLKLVLGIPATILFGAGGITFTVFTGLRMDISAYEESRKRDELNASLQASYTAEVNRE